MLLLVVSRRHVDLEDVESDGLGKRSALTDSNNVTLVNTESWGDMGSEVLVSLLVTRVLWNEVKVVSSDDHGTGHLGGDDGTSEDTASDGDKTSEWTLLVDVGTLDSGLWGLESKANVLIPSLVLDLRLWVLENVRLLLKSSLRLNG